MKEKPIMMSSPMVRAILEDRKSQTRRVKGLEYINKSPNEWKIFEKVDHWFGVYYGYHGMDFKCPYHIGDHLWVRETWMPFSQDVVRYKATSDNNNYGGKWHPSIFMPRWASRITLEVKNIRVERVQDISEEDVFKEGIEKFKHQTAYFDFQTLWDSINGKKYPFSSNPWVWIIDFKRI